MVKSFVECMHACSMCFDCACVYGAQAECDALLHPLLVRFAADRRLPALIKEARARRTSSNGSSSSSSGKLLLDEAISAAKKSECF